ncbi:MAG: DNA methyltransferase, partial [Planctomycetota bacterium]
FLEGLSNYWDDTQAPLMMSTKVKKLEKRYTPFSYRRDSMAAFERMFAMFQDSTIVMSYSSNAFPDLEVLESLLLKYKSKVEIAKRPHRYSFGTHAAAKESMRLTTEFLIIGT